MRRTADPEPETLPEGVILRRGLLDRAAQAALVEAVAAVVAEAPLVRPLTPWGKPMSVAMTSAGALGWVTDRRGYRYERTHPTTGRPWPPIPAAARAIWALLAPDAAEPDACLVNHYAGRARMGLHQDRDEADFAQPVVSISLGETATFRLGGLARTDPTHGFRLASGDVLVLGGPARLRFHGVDRLHPGSDDLLAGHSAFGGGRLNLTVRRAGPTDRRGVGTEVI